MVRLKVWKRRISRIIVSRFQFHYGSIKRNCVFTLSHFPCIFQFHYGSIKRHFRRWKMQLCYYFNSTMVRLKDRHRKSVCTEQIIFQFHYGSIKSKIIELAGMVMFNFNSTMVRLKAGSLFFQWFSVVISIPLWFD